MSNPRTDFSERGFSERDDATTLKGLLGTRTYQVLFGVSVAALVALAPSPRGV
jgi:tetrahydromethanopterin S-methyltransferase subunit B